MMVKHIFSGIFAFILSAAAAESEVIPIQARENLRIAYQVADERAKGHSSGSMHIPLDELRGRLSELPRDKEIFASCQSGQRSNFACRLHALHGFKVRNLAGSWRTFSTATL